MSYTGEQKKAYQREWMAERRKQGVQLLGGECSNCKSTENLEFDHVNPEQKWTHRFWSYAWERIEKELAKCQLLCEDCHRAKTKAWYVENVGHGLNLYKRYGCRCEICRAAKKIDNARRSNK
jgi:5-methylcytosine-specific restriction endonuclease McrA